MHPILEIIRPINSIMAAFGAFVGYSISSGVLEINFIVIAAMLAAFCVSSGGMVVNDYFDRDLDKMLKPHRPIPSGRVHPGEALMIAFFLFLLGNAFASLINASALVIAAGFSLFLIYYSKMLKQHKFVGNWVVASATGFTIIFGATAFELSATILVFAAAALLSNVSREIGKDFEDLENDIGFKKSLPMILPKRTVMILVSILLFFSMMLVYVPYTFYGFGNIYFLGLVTFANVLFLISLATMYLEKFYIFSATSKLAMAIALFGFLVGIF